MGIEKWSKKWQKMHPHATMQDFAVALSKRMIYSSIIMMTVQIIGFITVLIIVGLVIK